MWWLWKNNNTDSFDMFDILDEIFHSRIIRFGAILLNMIGIYVIIVYMPLILYDLFSLWILNMINSPFISGVILNIFCIIFYITFLETMRIFFMHMYSDKMIGKRISNHKFIKPFDKLSKIPFLGLYTTPVIMLIILSICIYKDDQLN